jgi:hypothetical protein
MKLNLIEKKDIREILIKASFLIDYKRKYLVTSKNTYLLSR